MKFFKSKTSQIDETMFFYIQRIMNLIGKKAYKFTNVSPSLARLLKREFIGEYLKENQTFFMNFNKNKDVVVINCTLGELETLLAKLLKEGL